MLTKFKNFTKWQIHEISLYNVILILTSQHAGVKGEITSKKLASLILKDWNGNYDFWGRKFTRKAFERRHASRCEDMAQKLGQWLFQGFKMFHRKTNSLKKVLNNLFERQSYKCRKMKKRGEREGRIREYQQFSDLFLKWPQTQDLDQAKAKNQNFHVDLTLNCQEPKHLVHLPPHLSSACWQMDTRI